jgi:hypothetical protein
MSADEGMEPAQEVDDEAADPAPASINPLLSESQLLPVKRKRSFRSMTSSSESTLAEITSAGEETVDKLMLDVVESLQSEGYILLTDAAKILQKRHTGRALDKMLTKLPVMAFSHSRKEGWIIIPKDEDEQYSAVMLLIKHVEELQSKVNAFGNLSTNEFHKVVAVATPSERLLLRYVLGKVYGIEEAARRYNMSKKALEGDMQCVETALESANELASEEEEHEDEGEEEGEEGEEHDEENEEQDEEEGEEGGKGPSKHVSSRVFHKALEKPHHGGRAAWEKDEASQAAAMGLIRRVVCTAVLSLHLSDNHTGRQNPSESKRKD